MIPHCPVCVISSNNPINVDITSLTSYYRQVKLDYQDLACTQAVGWSKIRTGITLNPAQT